MNEYMLFYNLSTVNDFLIELIVFSFAIVVLFYLLFKRRKEPVEQSLTIVIFIWLVVTTAIFSKQNLFLVKENIEILNLQDGDINE